MLKVKITFLTLLILIISPFTLADQISQYKEVLFSKILNEERTITVQVPESYGTNKNKKYPVIYRLDGKENLPLITEVMHKLQKADSAPEIIMVAIENTDRARDFAPTVNRDPRGPVGQGGGADKFLDFLEQELIPYINNKYQTHDFKVISGASVAGLFTIHSLQSRPHLFQAHMAYSPAVWWGDRTTAKKTKAFMSQAKHLDNYLYMNIGEEAGEMRAVYDDLHSYLQNNQPDKFKLVSNEFNNVPHGLTSAAGVFHAYQNLFLPLRMPNRELQDGVKSIKDYYTRLSLQRGEIIAPPEWVIRELGY
ncbi:esterase [Pseudoalteromonas sp. C2R02]|uniref:alpha/beta hydrolase n=1 Tax=Pseudoalteromonas sp. C2R02 TaxID=2841565 RepID=UPI001C09B7F7|nr:alpha/beta hydrolase-fold protein [Pseudoalteromonas sp. C2R02]MBU2972519.1 esterase [Pseudoalteromonas sp. C2R02]